MSDFSRILAAKTPLTLAAVARGSQPLVMADLARAAMGSSGKGRAVFIAPDDTAMRAVSDAAAFFAPDLDVIEFPAWDCLPYDRVSPNPELLARRMSTLAALSAGLPGPVVLLTTMNAVTQRLPAREVMRSASFVARVGDRVDEAQLKGFLARMGFSPVSTVAEPGDYAIRGGIVDIYPPGDGGPVRLDFFGDVLDGDVARRPVGAHQRKIPLEDRTVL